MNGDKVFAPRLATRRTPNQKRRRRSGGDDYSSSDDDGPPSKKNPIRGAPPGPPRPEEDEPASASSWLYRDRARERREGPFSGADDNNNDNENDESIFDRVVAAWESGDCQSSTKLVALRGLELPPPPADDSETPPGTWTEALHRLERVVPTSNLGKELLPFLRQQQQHQPPCSSTATSSTATTASTSWWRPSILTFSCNSAAVHRAWERPTERTTTDTTDTTGCWDDDDARSVVFLKGTLCTPSLLAAMEQSLTRAQPAWRRRPKKQEPHPKIRTSSCRSPNSTRPVAPPPAPTPHGSEDAAPLDDDDDIFGGVGEYEGATACLVVVPQDSTAAATTTNPDATRPARTANETSAPTTTTTGWFATETRPASVPGATNHNSNSNRLVGFASSSSSHQHSLYDGLDGIGMDFDGRDYDDEEEDAKKPKKKKKRRKKGPDSDDDDD